MEQKKVTYSHANNIPYLRSFIKMCAIQHKKGKLTDIKGVENESDPNKVYSIKWELKSEVFNEMTRKHQKNVAKNIKGLRLDVTYIIEVQKWEWDKVFSK